MINQLTHILIKNNIINEDDQDIYDYGLFVIIFNMLSIGVIILISLLTHQFHFTMAFLLFYLPNRMVMGGYHCQTPTKCFITFCSTFIIILLLSKNLFLSFTHYFITLISYGILLMCHIKNKNIFILILIALFFILLTLLFPLLQNAFIYATTLNILLFLIKAIKEIVFK